MTSAIDRSSGSGLVARILLTALIVLGLAACGTKTEAQLASDALEAGLQAQTAGNIDQAAADYKECLKHDATNKFCLYDLGTVAQAQNLSADAENDYHQSLAADPSYAPAIYNLAILRTQAGANAEAIALYRQYIAIKPDDAAGHFNLGLLLNQTGDTTDGASEIAQALKLNPALSSRLPSPSTGATGSSTSDLSPSAKPSAS